MRTTSFRALKWWLLALAPAFVAVLGVAVPWLRRGHTHSPNPYTLEVVVRHSGHEHRVPPGGPVPPGEKLGFQLSTERSGYFTLLEVGSVLGVTHVLPKRHEPLAIPAGRAQKLNGDVRLDAALGPERFIALVCDTPLPEERAREAAEHELTEASGNPAQMGPLDVPCQQTMFLIEKVAPL
ncbi:hypothetical protein [Vitiosangium sp. GDMCC 1.1324]|uniref:hypothetical protein n=1 Tax=Vitiosangium sp. (strain GDMCC 1.1324) TaxID=2138576 RepID=UPI000D358FC2|nr:hypothetical protein [Vitiosangium sp. GDMCC 1.1324]PTL84494.1 hypothetical protein DAT35_05240 [Vitiosangium sp. GDMCC 1.1324]